MCVEHETSKKPRLCCFNCMEGDGWFTAVKLGRISGPGLINALSGLGLCACLCFCTWPLSLTLLLYRLSVCSPLVQGPDEVSCIINVAALPVFCYGGRLSSESNNCHPQYSCDFHKRPPRLGLLTVGIPTRRRDVGEGHWSLI